MTRSWPSLRASIVPLLLALLWLAAAPARAASGPDLALNRPVVASSVQSTGTPAGAAVDGSASTRWSSAFSDPQWIYVDLGATYNVSEVVLNWETAYGKAYQVQVSSDAVNWTTIYSTSSAAGGVNDLTGLSGTGRYVRMYGTARGTYWGYSLWEMSVYGTPAAAPPDTTPPGTPAGASVPTHIDTWSLDDCGQGSTASSALVRQWLSFAETNCGPNTSKANTDCHAGGVTYCKTLNYLDPSWQWSSGGLTYNAVSAAAAENWWLHQAGYTDAAHRLAATCSGGVGYLIDQAVLGADQWFRDYVRSNFGAWDGTFMDDTNGGMSQQFYNCGGPSYSTSQELTSDAQLQSAHQLMASTMTNSDGSGRFQVDNGEQANPNLAKMNSLLDNPGSMHGLSEEGDPWWGGGFAGYFSSLLDDMAYVDNNFASGYFLLLHPYESTGSAAARRVSIATALLGYSQGHTVLREDVNNGVSTDLAVFPEEGIYPAAPLQTMGPPGGSGCEAGKGAICSTGGHNDLRVASGTNGNDSGAGVYRREFGNCYNQGVAFGHCAVIVNDTSSTVNVASSWLSQSYGHQISFSGGDVQSGGTINVAGAGFTAGSTTIPANDAILLAP